MFYYLPEDTFSDLEMQNASHVLMGLKQALMEVYYHHNNEDL